MDTKQFKEFAPIGSSSSDFWRTFSDAVAHSKTLHIHDVIFGGINFVSASALKTSMPVKLRVFHDYYLKQHAETRNNYSNAQYAKCIGIQRESVLAECDCSSDSTEYRLQSH